jgi:aspartate beta-hydroxylase
MQQKVWEQASAAYERTLKLDPTHRGALVNGVHCIQMLPPTSPANRKKLERVSRMGVAAGLWTTWLQRPPHLLPGLRSQPWWDKRAFAWCALLERNYAQIRAEVPDDDRTSPALAPPPFLAHQPWSHIIRW